MNGQLRILSVYEGFFSGGARILHSDVVRVLHGTGQRHGVLALQRSMRRDGTSQDMEDDACYRTLTASGVGVTALGGPARPDPAGVFDVVDPTGEFGADDLRTAAGLVAASDVVLVLKEQPLRLVKRLPTHGRPVVVCLHRSDPANDPAALDDLREGVATGLVTACVCCAESTRAAYRDAGIPDEFLHTIPNGVDLARFRPSRRRRARTRRQLGIPADAPVIVFAARYDPLKNVALLLAAAAIFLRDHPNGHVLMCGGGMAAENPGLRADLDTTFAADPALARRVHLLGIRHDMEAVYAAADVVALTSAEAEAAPLCLIEGMMSGAVPVATDAGDSARIVGDRGIVTPRHPLAVAEAWEHAVRHRRAFRAAADRDRELFAREQMVAAYRDLLERVGHAVRTPRVPTAQVS